MTRPKRPMSTRELTAAVAVMLAACLFTLAYAWNRWSHAGAAADAADAGYAVIATQVHRLESLRREQELVDDRPRPRSEIVEPFKSVLHAHGISPAAVTQITLPDPQPIAGTPFQRQQASLTLERVNVPELVRVLAAWSTDQPLWTMRLIRLERSSARGGIAVPSGENSPATDGRFDAYITLENVHLSAAPATSAPATSPISAPTLAPASTPTRTRS